MDKLNNTHSHMGFVVSATFFALMSVNALTYFLVHNYSIENTQKTLAEKLSTQANFLQLLSLTHNATTDPATGTTPNANLKSQYQAALKQITALHRQENYFLIQQNSESKRAEIAYSTKSTPLIKTDHNLSINQALYKTRQLVHPINYSENQITYTAFTPIQINQWGILVQKTTPLLNEDMYKALTFTTLSSLFLTLLIWLFLKIQSRKFKKREVSLEEKYQSLLHTNRDWVWEVDVLGNFKFSNDQVFDILGIRKERIIEKNINTLFDASFEKNNILSWKQKVMLNQQFNNLEVAFTHQNGQTIHLLMGGYPLFDEDKNPNGFRGIAHDITPIKNREYKIINQAYYDNLTQLFNRQHLIDLLDEHIRQFQNKNTQTQSAILYIDLDGFKKINDQLGHEFGDQLLKIIAKRMKEHARKEDIIGRIGGDEFVVLISSTDNLTIPEFVNKLETYAKRLIHTIGTPVKINNTMTKVGASIGVAILPQYGDNLTEILNNADIAMYHAKSRGKNTYEFYNLDTQKAVDQKIKTSGELDKAIENNQFDLYYQLQFSNDKVTGMEALLRWHHPDSRKVISAGDFLSKINNAEQARVIDQWVINRVAEDITQINQVLTKTIPVSINLSIHGMFESTLPETIEAALKRNFITGHAFNIEVSENILAENFVDSSQTVIKLSKLGVNTHLEHFGTGYLSLSNLQTIPIEAIKIDKSFVDNIATQHTDLQMCQTIIQLAKSMQLKVIAEGIETTIQKDILEKEGCDIMQGYAFAQPMTLNKILGYLKDNQEIIA